jgi:hypothetical protein
MPVTGKSIGAAQKATLFQESLLYIATFDPNVCEQG